MSISDKPDDLRRTAKRSVPTAPPGLRRGADKWIARRAGAGPRSAGPTEAAGPVGQVIKLSWADTFGRPPRPDLGWLFHAAPTTAQVLPFRSRALRDDGPAAP